jgi:oligopeptidase B
MLRPRENDLMNYTTIVTLAVLGVSLSAGRLGECQEAPGGLKPPNADVVPTRFEQFGHVRVDNYYWLKERTDPKVIGYLEAENAYTDAFMGHTKSLQKTIYDEIVARIKEADVTAPVFDNGYYYYSRFAKGQQYPVLVRKRGSLDAAEEVLLDEPAMAAGQGYFSLGTWQVSPDNRLVAYAVDTGGRLFYTIRIKDLSNDKILADTIADVTSNLAWANDSRTLFYTKQDPKTLRAYRIQRHALGEQTAADSLAFEEADETFSCRVARTRSDRYLMIASRQTLSTEFRFLDADTPTGAFTVIQPRRPNLEYSVDHLGDDFYFRTNLDAKNFRLMKAPVRAPALENWRDVVPHRDDVFLERFELFRDHLVVAERRDGLIRLRIRPWSGEPEHQVDFGEPAYLARIGPNPEVNTDTVRYVYTSLTTPMSSYDYNMTKRSKTLVKREEVQGGFDPAEYVTERLHATAPDGVKVPISVVYRKGFPRDGSRPLLLTGYGSYGASRDPSFDSERLSLLDRGFGFAIAHVRGGQELGRAWYEDGKLLKKKNTFTDFVACADFLIREGYTRSDRLFAQGGSAGGLLMGAVINMRPDLFKGVVAAVPFVDVVTTMLDPSIPLTTFEYDEWGNPTDRAYFEYMLSYSPYDNVEAKAYPNLLVTTSLQDSQVQYWEPAKWVAKLRASKTDTNKLLLRTYMKGSHGGVSGRYKRYEQTAFVYAFILDLMGLAK